MKKFFIGLTIAHILFLIAVRIGGVTFEQNPNGYLTLVVATGICALCALTIPSARKKYIACCSAALSDELEAAGIPSKWIVCPYQGKMSTEFFEANLKKYQYMLFDGNPTDGEVSMTDVEAAAKASLKSKVILRVDQSEFVVAGINDRYKLLLFGFANSNSQVTLLGTAPLIAVIKKYYGIKN